MAIEVNGNFPAEGSRPKMLRPPRNRDVARPVANLGNTCYMNAVLQALAHAPELCMAVDVEPHHANCPIYMRNALKKRSSPSSSPEWEDMTSMSTGTRKSRRSGGKKSPTNLDESTSDLEFCALCEVEQHLSRVHMQNGNRDRPVAPSTFVNGFIEHVAPWFNLGQQEDSHEFLRLLIDAMQKSCKQARPAHGNPQDTPPPQKTEEEEKNEDSEYPFQLFRGMVESNVTCESCESTSSTRDPIEDIGLDVSPLAPPSSSAPSAGGFLNDVSSALQCFARAEALDSGYKCEKCGKVGRATKQSRLASIPPILTLHLKRFRYGGDGQKSALNVARRSNRSELNQLLGYSAGEYFTGKSGSAKIEGHSKFEQILDLKPYLTDELQEKYSSMFCRLFAVIVHAGKNSHSGHYIAYVRNITKNEWWKMDDARITVAPLSEVMNAEAYMLFYRVMDHPFATGLRERADKLRKELAKEALVTIKGSGNKGKEGSSTAATASTTKSKTTNHRKRKAPEFSSGEDWAKAKTSISLSSTERFREIERAISDGVNFTPEFLKLLTEQASKANARVGHGPSSGICEEDIVHQNKYVKLALTELFYRLYKEKKENPFLKSEQRASKTPMSES